MKTWGVLFFPSQIVFFEIIPEHYTDFLWPRSLVSTGLSDTYSREEMLSPPQTRGWLGTRHACETVHYETLEQLFKKPSLE